MTSPGIPNLEGLDDLARLRGVDTRPTLARVLTDLYVQKPAHTLDEEIHYTELVLRLIEAVDVPTRAIVAQKLSAYAAAPRAVVLRLARDVIEVAEPVLRHSPCLPGPELVAIIEECGPLHAAAIAARRGRAGASAPSAAPTPRPSAASLLPRSSQWRRAIAAAQPAAPTTEIGLGELFLAAAREERAVILANLDPADPAPTRPIPSDSVARLEAAALARGSEEFAIELERAFGVTGETARRMADDPSGEPLLLAAKALDMSGEALVRILLFINPTIGESVSRVFALAQLYADLPRAAALQVLESLRGAAPARPMHQPALWNDDADAGRRAGTDAARRGLMPTGQPQPARRDPSAPARRHGTT
ncbi:MAG TPA: hypothetical protein VEK73_23275 [Xanthobacteraceae bacterium]|nr:hypothetical protein [Xanthobacteraceae bacterium]